MRRLSFFWFYALMFFSLSAQTLQIESMKGSDRIVIGGKNCGKGDTFDAKDMIVWTGDTKMMWVSQVGTTKLYLLSSDVFAATGSHTAFDYINKNDGKKQESAFVGTKKQSTRGEADACFSAVFPKYKSVGDEKRIALLIGNSNYRSEHSLYTPVADVIALTDKFRELGFNVYVCYDADLNTMKECIRRFADFAQNYNTALVYYAGHGQQYNDDSYLMPVDAVIETPSDITERCFPTSRAISFLNDVKNLSTRLLFIDACRSEQQNRLLASRGNTIDQLLNTKELAQGIILFSTQSGNVAFDFGDTDVDHSPFASSLLSRLDAVNQTISDLIIDITNDVETSTSSYGAPQRPRSIPTLSHRFYFNPAVSTTGVSANDSMSYADGEYEGETKDGVRHGFGTMKYSGGNKYIGIFKNDKRDGQGSYFWANGDKYIGEWKEGLREGHGLYTTVDGHTYDGDYANDRMNGHGIYMWPDGKRYVGEFRNGHQEGNGTMVYSDGSKYVGEWKNGSADGHGIMFFPDGSSYEGEWKEGTLIE